MTDELEALMRQKEALYARTDLDPEEKDKLARRLRRQIRKVRGDDPSSGGSSGDASRPASRSRRSRRNPSGTGRSASGQPELFTQWKAELLEFLVDIGLDWRDPHDLLNQPTMGISLVTMFEDDVAGDQLFLKFQHRWANKDPLWFSTHGTGTAEILLLGPLPGAMTS